MKVAELGWSMAGKKVRALVDMKADQMAECWAVSWVDQTIEWKAASLVER